MTNLMTVNKIVEFLKSPYTGDLIDIITAEHLLSSLIYHKYNIKELNLGDVDIKLDDDDHLYLFKYKGHKTFSDTWNLFEGISRGLVIGKYGGIIYARGFPKFFNYNQTINGKLIAPSNLEYVFEKIDGTYIQTFYSTKWHVTGHGNFVNDFTKSAEELLKNKYNFLNNSRTYSDKLLTFIFEYVCPESKVVVNYENQNELYLLAIRNNISGLFLDVATLQKVAEQHNFKLPKCFDFNNYNACLEYFSSLPSDIVEEGFVAYSDDFTTMVKIKSSEYVRLHGLQKDISLNKLINSYKIGEYQLNYEKYEEEFHDYINYVKNEIEQFCFGKLLIFKVLFRKIKEKSTDRKHFNELIQQSKVATKNKHYLYSLYDERDNNYIYCNIVKENQSALLAQIKPFEKFLKESHNESFI